MKRIYALILLMLCLAAGRLSAQKTVIESVKETTDFIPADDQRKDYNQDLCALVKVQVVDDITSVEGNVMGDIVKKGVEKWVYMAKDSRNIKIHLKNNLPVRILFRDYDINGLKSNRVYEIILTVTNAPQPVPVDDKKKAEEERKAREKAEQERQAREKAEAEAKAKSEAEARARAKAEAEAQERARQEAAARQREEQRRQKEQERQRQEQAKAAERQRQQQLKDEQRRARALRRQQRPQLVQPTCFYVLPTFQAGSLMAVGASVGAHLGGFNIEAGYFVGLSKPATIYWNYSGDDDRRAVACEYKPSVMSLRLGYGIVAGKELRITPQAGVDVVQASADGSKCSVTNGVVGLRLDYALTKNITLFAAPQIGFAAQKGDVYKQLESVTDDFKKWSGFNARAGLMISF